jgi:hypothetical protein
VAHIPVEQSVLYSARAEPTFMLLRQGDGVRRILQGRMGLATSCWSCALKASSREEGWSPPRYTASPAQSHICGDFARMAPHRRCGQRALLPLAEICTSITTHRFRRGRESRRDAEYCTGNTCSSRTRAFAVSARGGHRGRR